MSKTLDTKYDTTFNYLNKTSGMTLNQTLPTDNDYR